MILGFCGFAQVGKDTLGAYVCEHYGTTRYAFADELKRQYCEMQHLSLSELEKNKNQHRDGIVALSRARKNEFGQDYWVQALDKQISSDKIVVTDVRYDFEVEWIRSKGGKVFWISRPGFGAMNNEEYVYTTPVENICDDWIYNGDLTETYNKLEYLLRRHGFNND